MSAEPLRHILFVEDDPDIHAIVEFALAKAGGLSVVACRTGLEALQAVQRFRPDLVLLDVMLPELDGPGTLEALRRIPGHESTPVVFLTALAKEREFEEYRALGAIGVISKPFDPTALAETLNGIWRRHHGDAGS